MKDKARAFIGIALLAFLAVLLAILISEQGWLGAPASDKNDLLGQLFGGARQAVSGNMMERADQYYHGGVGHQQCETPHLPDEDHEDHEDHEDQEGHDEHDGHAPPPDSDGKIRIAGDEQRDVPTGGGWWARLNEALHPRGHVHLHGERQTRELLPWMWAAVKADPENIEASITTAYWLSSQLDKSEQALDILNKAISRNPDSYELLLAKGRIIRNHRQDLETAAQLFRKALDAWHENHSYPPSDSNAARSYYALCLQRAMALSALDRNKEAAAVLEKALPYSPHPNAIRQRMQELQDKTPAD